MQSILYCSFNMGRHYIRVILGLTIARAKIITNIMPTNVKTTIKYYSLHQLFLKQHVNNDQFRQWKLKIDKNGFKKCNIKVILISSKNDRIYHVDSV